MKLCWHDDQRLGVVVDDEIRDVHAALRVLPPLQLGPPRGDWVLRHLDLLRPEVERLQHDAPRKPVRHARLLSPVLQPSKIIGVPVNYLKHVEEAAQDQATFTDRYRGSITEQGLFLKATSSLVGCSEGVRLRFPGRTTHHEIELAAIIGREVTQVSEQEAMACVAGYSIALDMTVRGGEDRSLRKSIDSYSVLGPWLVTADEVPDPQALGLRLSVDGVTRQESNTALMIMKIAEQIAWASRFYTLYPGDVIMTGTCEGVGPVLPGNTMHCHIDRIGAMDVAVHSA